MSDPLGAREYSICEAVADIAYIAGQHGYYGGNSRTDVDDIIKWAIEFDDKNSGRVWDGEYMEEIEAFAVEKMEL